MSSGRVGGGRVNSFGEAISGLGIKIRMMGIGVRGVRLKGGVGN